MFFLRFKKNNHIPIKNVNSYLLYSLSCFGLDEKTLSDKYSVMCIKIKEIEITDMHTLQTDSNTCLYL